MCCKTIGYPATPATMPATVSDPHSGAVLGELEAAAWAGTIRNPQPVAPGKVPNPADNAPDASILDRVLGRQSRPSRNSFLGTLYKRTWDGQGDAGNDGAHVEMPVGAFIPQQGQNPQAEMRGNTWRAAPTPWDARYVDA